MNKLANGIEPVFYAFTARNRYASIKFRNKQLSGMYLEGNDGIEVFNSSCSVVGTPQAYSLLPVRIGLFFGNLLIGRLGLNPSKIRVQRV